MSKIHEKIMRANFAKWLKRLVIAAVCVALLGGGLSAVMLAPQIREAVSYSYEREQAGEYRSEGWDNGEDFGEHGGREEERGHSERHPKREKDRDEEHDFFEKGIITKPSMAALITAGVTGLLMSALLVLFWLLVAAWLYQAAVLSGMSGPFWLIAGMAGNVFAAVLFLLIRSFIRVRCPSCGSFQRVETQHCTRCGAAFYEKCGSCGTRCAAADKFCHACGKELREKEQ